MKMSQSYGHLPGLPNKIITGMNAVPGKGDLKNVKRVLNFPILHMVMVMVMDLI